MIFLGTVPACILLVGMFFMPPSPRWLVSKNKIQEAIKILKRIRNTSADAEIAEIQDIVQQPRIHLVPFFFSKRWRKPLIIGTVLGILQQFFGINTVMYYGPFIFKAVGFHGASTQILATFLLGIINVVMTIFTGIYVDRWGRRTLLMWGSLISGASLLTVVLLLSFFANQASWMLLLSLVFYIIGYSISVGSLFWLIISEIFPLHVRSTAMSFATAIQWLANFVVSIAFLSVLEFLGASIIFSCFAVVCFISFIFAFTVVPETKGMTLEAIEHSWKNTP